MTIAKRNILLEQSQQYLDNHRQRLGDLVHQSEPGDFVVQEHARVMDGLLQSLFDACAFDSGLNSEGSKDGLAVVATGGFGRQMLGIHSDVDLMFLHEEVLGRETEQLASDLLHLLWDLGLQTGHTIRTPDEIIAASLEDLELGRLETITSLHDARCVVGDGAMVQQLRQRSVREVFGPHKGQYIELLKSQRIDRHRDHGDSSFLLEPEIKLGRGGLRDIDVFYWVAEAGWGTKSLTTLIASEAILEHEIEELEQATRRLWSIRNALHIRAGRRQDRLSFEDQEEIAPQLGFRNEHESAVESFMRVFYQDVSLVARTTDRLISRALLPEESAKVTRYIDNLVSEFDGSVGFTDEQAPGNQPETVFRLYDEIRRSGMPAHPFARDLVSRLAADAEWACRLRDSAEACDLFLELLAESRELPVAGGTLAREFHDVGLLFAMIPEFEPVFGKVHHDLYHVYTVDVHSAVVVSILQGIRRGFYTESWPLACRLAAELDDPVPLVLAALLHDIGKGRKKDHSQVGKELSLSIAKRLGIDDKRAQHVSWLIEHHLTLYHWAVRRDISDPATIDELANLVSDSDRLRDLYLLTVADISGTNPAALSSWKSQVLQEVYFALSSVLQGTSIEQRVQALRRALTDAEGTNDPDAVRRFVNQMPDRYLLGNPPSNVIRHAEIIGDQVPDQLCVHGLTGRSEDSYELLVWGKDRPGLLAQVAGVLAVLGFDIVSAQVYTLEREDISLAVDLFDVRKRNDEENSKFTDLDLNHIQQELNQPKGLERRTISSVQRMSHSPSWAKKKEPEVKVELRFDNLLLDNRTVVEVFAKDDLGLLYAVASALSKQGLSIKFSKINTEGHRASDVFYVVDAAGNKLSQPTCDAVEREIRAAIAVIANEV